jgi:hypothetical protein
MSSKHDDVPRPSCSARKGCAGRRAGAQRRGSSPPQRGATTCDDTHKNEKVISEELCLKLCHVALRNSWYLYKRM